MPYQIHDSTLKANMMGVGLCRNRICSGVAKWVLGRRRYGSVAMGMLQMDAAMGEALWRGCKREGAREMCKEEVAVG